MKYDNLRLCNDYIADMEGQLDAIATALGVSRGKPDVLIASVNRLEAERDALRECVRLIVAHEDADEVMPNAWERILRRCRAELAKTGTLGVMARVMAGPVDESPN